ncbi:MAG TPA: phytanoyl-CoA dioxygenase family protein [Streptosporangiaceae bacterium]|nr:phytanoyl-CoA dioxygenase family protein [Streptosporangiaceae bacterium]
MPLDADELTAFAANGIIIKRGFVAPELVGKATSLVTEWYRTAMDQSQLAEFTQRTFAPHLGSHPDVLALFTNSGIADLTRTLVGDFTPVTTTQIQIRVPEAELGHEQPDKAMHVDGVACPHLDPAELRTFSLLVGVALSGIRDPAGGALRYVPGGHLRMAEWFRTEWSLGITEQTPPHIGAQEGIPFLADPGDALLMHHLVPHAVGRNRTTTPRIMAYFRVSHVSHAGRRLDALRDPWLDFPPLTARVL